MGVPGFFLWLLKRYRKNGIIKSDITSFETKEDNSNVNTLYLDANCLIHPQCKKARDMYPNWKTFKFIEKKMIIRIIKYIQFLVDRVQPKTLFIAIDGVAPAAKLKQQRTRRYKSVKDSKIVNDLNAKYEKPLIKEWDTTAITPGTQFMERLIKKINKHINNNGFINANGKKIKCIFSSSNIPGEGEHKILQHLRINAQNQSLIDVIYGLDADLIFLALANDRDNLFLLREASQISPDKAIQKNDLLDDDEDIEEELNYVSIDKVKDSIYNFISSQLEDITVDKQRIIFDYIFICYFMGNDFLPHFPSVNIQNSGMDLILKCYINGFIIHKSYIVNESKVKSSESKKYKLNIPFLHYFLSQLSKGEVSYFRYSLPKHLNNRFHKKSQSKEPYDIELFRIRNLQYEIHDPIMLGYGLIDEWKFRYYEHYFHIINNEESVNDICNEYLKGLLWVTQYYFNKCVSWSWYYPYDHAPFISDFWRFIENYEEKDFEFDIDKPLTPHIQLLSVLPPSCSYLLPLEYQKLMTDSKSPLIDLYPIVFDEDMINKDMLWKCIPILPPLNLKRVKQAVKKIKNE